MGRRKKKKRTDGLLFESIARYNHRSPAARPAWIICGADGVARLAPSVFIDAAAAAAAAGQSCWKHLVMIWHQKKKEREKKRKGEGSQYIAKAKTNHLTVCSSSFSKGKTAGRVGKRGR